MNLFLTYLKEALKLYWFYIKRNTSEKLKEALLKALEAFKNTLWNEVKDTVYSQTLSALQAAEAYYKTEQVKIKEKELISQIVDSLKLPLVLRPFKGLMKSLIIKKIEEIIQEALKNGQEFLSK